jgi:hypothetical protein
MTAADTRPVETDAAAFGPWSFTLTPEEAEAVAARYGLRSALAGGLTARHHAPLAAFLLVMAFASILALTDLISRRAGEIAILVAAMAFMIQRLATHWRLRSARARAKAALAGEQGPRVVALDPLGVGVEGGAQSLDYADLEEAEDAGGLVYFWPHRGAPIVLPTRALLDGEAGRVVAEVRLRMQGARGRGGALRRGA